MNALEWLLAGDPVLQRLVKKELLDEACPYTEDGLIGDYLALFDSQTGLWGGGVYGPKWVSTHYTMMELKYMAVDPHQAFYQIGLGHLLDKEWHAGNRAKSCVSLDLCVLGMLVSLGAYGRSQDPRLFEVIDYILEHTMADGGWNCAWDSANRPSKKSSLHTTLSILEGFKDYIKSGYAYKKELIESMIPAAEDFILKKELFKSVSTGEMIHPELLKFHYPPRWKYDVLRAMEYFADVKRPYDERMSEALDLIIQSVQKGYAIKGSQYSGPIHFKLEASKGGRFNTFRAFKILKLYAPEVYLKASQQTELPFEK